MLVEQIITERYVNLFVNDAEKRRHYLEQVWDILQKSYAPIGGIKGNGFQSPEAMLQLPMWKLAVRDGAVRAVVIYKDKGGRKAVAIGTDGSRESVWFVRDILKNELGRSYLEQSKAALGATMKTYPFEILEPFLQSPAKVAKMTPDERVIPIKQVDKAKWPADAITSLSKFPQLIDYGYLRDIGGDMVFKVMLGSPGKSITEDESLEEGPNDPSIYKAVFLAGGPGSGKSYIVDKTAFTAMGFKVVNNDNAFEKYLADAGLEPTPDNIFSRRGQEIRGKAKAVTNMQMKNYLQGTLGLVIDGTGKDYEKITSQANKLKALGYDVAMVFVNTDEETALKRNRMRPRQLPDEQVSKMWADVQKNIGKFQSYFGNSMYIIDNSEGYDVDQQTTKLYTKIGAWAKKVGPRRKTS